jgi:N-acetylglucosamine-6-phosphate deacetylase
MTRRARLDGPGPAPYHPPSGTGALSGRTQSDSGALSGRTPAGDGVRVSFAGGRITAVEPFAAAPDTVICPGLIDLQVNGYQGYDVNADTVTPEEIAGLAYALRRRGVTGFCPTVITAPEDRIVHALRAIARARQDDPAVARAILGVHVEGPYLAAGDGPRGAHDAAAVRDPDIAEFGRWQDAAGGLVRIVTLAPERPGAERYIAHLAAAGVLVSIGHTAASAAQIRAAVAAGARMSTHLGNGCHERLHRHDNMIWPQLAADELTAGFIADGHHLPADAFTAMVRAKGVDRCVLVSDSATLAGSAPGRYRTPTGGAVTVEPDGRLTLTGTPYLAGSGAALAECLDWAVRNTPVSLPEAVAMASGNPARLLRLADRGAIRPGAAADLVVLATDRATGLRCVAATVVAGEVVFDAAR